jgi:hypothetical protein
MERLNEGADRAEGVEIERQNLRRSTLPPQLLRCGFAFPGVPGRNDDQTARPLDKKTAALKT